MDDPIKTVSAIQANTAASIELRPGDREPVEQVDSAAPELPSAELRGLKETRSFGDRVAEFAYDDAIGRIVVTIYSANTEPREVVRQIPPEDFLAFAASYREFLGVLFDKQA
jgi:uncharacterized FlaG/YvyC family protein